MKMYAGKVGCYHAYFEGAPGTWEASDTQLGAVEKLRVTTGHTGEIEIVDEGECAACEGASLRIV